jgi:hypothetical protein
VTIGIDSLVSKTHYKDEVFIQEEVEETKSLSLKNLNVSGVADEAYKYLQDFKLVNIPEKSVLSKNTVAMGTNTDSIKRTIGNMNFSEYAVVPPAKKAVGTGTNVMRSSEDPATLTSPSPLNVRLSLHEMAST